MKPYPIFLMLLFSVQIGLSQNHHIRFQHLDINNGISQNHILCILQDSRGFMWFGTRDGLNKYDGYQFTIYRHDAKDSASISNDFISSIVEDSKGFIWVSTRGGGINRYDRNKNNFTHFQNDPSNTNSLASNLVDGIAKDDNDNLWFCTENNGVDFYDTKLNRFTHYKHNAANNNSLCDDNTRCVIMDSEKNIWIGGYGGLNYFNRKSKKITHYKHSPGTNNSLSNNDIKIIFEDSKKRIWIGTDGGGLNLFDKSSNSFKRYLFSADKPNSISASVIAAIAEDREGNIWIGTENGGLDILDPVSGDIEVIKHDDIDSKSISQNSIYSIYRDNNYNMWVGTYSGGINIFSKDANKFPHYYHNSGSNSLSNNLVLSITESANGKLWIGTDGGGLDLFDPVSSNFRHFVHDNKNSNSICGNYVLCVTEDSKGNVWIGTWGDGITVYNPNNSSYHHFKYNPADAGSLNCNNIYSILEDSEQNIWVGTYGGGLNLFDPKTNSFKHLDENNKDAVSQQIFNIIEDKKGNLYVGTDGDGLRILNKAAKTYRHLVHETKNRNSISDNRINYLYLDAQENIWIGTMNGLDCLDATTGEIKHYNTEDGLPNNVIFAIVEDADKNFWISTNKGLSKFNRSKNTFKNYTPADGLQSYEFKGHAVCKTKTGALYFGGINGFNKFYPASIEETDVEFPVVFTGFEIFNKKIPIAKNSNDPSPLKQDIAEAKQIELPYDDAVISFEFAALNYTADEKKQYAYLLKGFDKDWNYIGSKHTATFTNLNPGRYNFMVKAKNKNGEWSKNIKTIELIIKPPFWLTWWFEMLVAAGFIAGIVLFNRFRFKIIQKQKLILQKKVTEQTRQLVLSANEEKKAREAADKARLQAENANREMQQKNKEIEQFVYIASHDLQEPLRTTTSFVELLQRQYGGSLDEKADKYLNFITDASKRMKVLIKDLLDYSRIGAKKDLARIDCNLLMQAVLADLGNAISEANATIIIDQLPVISGYNTEIKQLFQNLIINAIKFRKKDEPPRIQVSVSSKPEHWQFSIKDNGIGIAPEHREKIFLIFQRLHTKSQYEGSGIGLAHAKKIVEIHGGEIWPESTLGVGTTFFFTISKKLEDGSIN